MNQITRCPNCSTSFRVTDDQLAAHHGKVRCGRCSFIFNARDFLQQTAPTPETITQGIASETTPKAARSNIPTETANQSAITPQQVEAKAQPQNKPELSPARPAPIEAAFPVIEPSETTPDEKQESNERELKRALARLIKKSRKDKTRKTRKPSRNTIAEPIQDTQPDWATNADEAPTSSEDRSEAEYQPILDETDDLFLPAKRSRWYWLWSLGSVVLTLTLLAQLAYNFRLELSQEFPALRPKWQALCLPLQCEMPLPKEAQLLRSEWSELTYIPDHPTLIQVKATLRNLAPFEQALPKLELTLTDESERVLAKKVFTPQQYLAQDENAQTSLQASEELHAFLQLDLGTLNSTGYSLFWFYD